MLRRARNHQVKRCVVAMAVLLALPGVNCRREGVTAGGARADVPAGVPFTHVTVDSSGPEWSTDRGMHIKSIGDLNGDGYLDLIVAGSLIDQPLVWYQSPTWTKHTVSQLGGWSTDAETGDIDNDGDQDIVISSWYRTDQGVEWFENTGGGVSWTYHVIGAPRAHDMELADFDLDGDLDVVTRQQGSAGSKLEFWRQETPTSWTHRTLTTDVPTGEGLMVGDIDRDGDADVVIGAIWYENTRNIVDGPWTAHTYTTAWTKTDVTVAVADINRDGRLDVVLVPAEAAGQRYRIAWYEAPSDPTAGGWVEHVVDSDTECVLHSLAVVDIDKDGDDDILTAEMHQSADPDEVRVYVNQGAGGVGASWSKQVIAASGSHFFRVADFDRDGDNDVFGANWTGTRVVDLWRNDLDNRLTLDRWERHVVDAARPWNAVFISSGDLDRDGKPDIVTGGWWYRNPGTPDGTWARNTLGSPLNNMAAVYDYDRDGDLDVLGTPWAGSGSSPEFHWARNDGSGSFAILSNITAGQGDFLQGVAVGRFRPTGPLETALSWHAGTGHGVQMLTTPPDPSAETWLWRRISNTDQQEQLSAGDIDRDGDLDLLLGTRWLRNDGETYSLHTLFDTQDQPDRNRLADINRDGRLDAVVGYLGISSTAKLAWYEQPTDPTGLWSEHVIATVIGPMSLDVGDLDRDGDLDVVVGEHNLANPSAAGLFVFENADGSGTTWTQHTVHVGDEHHDGAQLVDIDRDGDLDIISIGWGHKRVLLYENKASASGTGGNVGPTVDAGLEQYVTWPAKASLDGTVEDDGLPDPPAAVTLTWSRLSGPGIVVFGDPHAEDTTVWFSEAGVHVLQLEADDGELTASDQVTVRVLAPGQRVTEALTALYTFEEGQGTAVLDVSGVGTPLDLTIADSGSVTWGSGTLSINTATLISSSGPAAKLYDAMVPTNEITVEAWITPASVTQIGPARIVTLSGGLSSRNLTLGQGLWVNDPRDVVNVRLRTTATSDDGEPGITTPAGSITTDLTHVVYTRDSPGTARIYIDGVEELGAIVGGDLSNWDSGYAFALANELTGDRPWLGTFHLVAIYNRALKPVEVGHNFLVGAEPAGALLPVVAAMADDATDPGVPYNRSPTLIDGTPPVIWSLVTAPAGMTIDTTTGRVSWPDPQPPASDHPVTLAASNSAGSDETSWTLTVNPLPPVITVIADHSTPPGLPYSLTPTLAQGTPPVTWSLLAGPTSMTIDPGTGEVAWPDPQPPDSSHLVRIQAANSAGSDEKSFMLRVRVLPAGIVSDDFNACSLDETLWQTVNPLGDAVFTVSGTGSADAGVAITLPAGTTHEAWISGNNVPRVMQAAQDSDFEIEVKFDAPMLGAYRMQGVIIEQDEDDFLRFEFYSSETENHLFVAVISGSSSSVKKQTAIPIGSPLFMSISREGALWTQNYSYDGVTWVTGVSFTHYMTVTAVGPFVGNVNLGFTGIIDYFFNRAAPIDPEDGPPPGNPGTILAVNTVGSGHVVVDPDQSCYYCDEIVTLSAVPEPGWLFEGWSGDATGSDNPVQLAMTADKVVTATFFEDLAQPPIIADLPDDVADPGTPYSRTPTLLQGTPPVTWSLIQGPSGMTIDTQTGEVNWANPQPPDSEHLVTVAAGNGVGSDEAAWTLTVSAWIGHPADTDDDWCLQINEVTAYASCWKSGCAWPVPPDPIPIAYVSRAGFLWKAGEQYHRDPAYVCDEEHADCFQPGNEGKQSSQVLQRLSSRLLADTLEAVSRPRSTLVTEQAARPLAEGQADAPRFSGYRCMAPEEGTLGRYSIRIELTLPPRAQAWAIEELPPRGWGVSDISESGSFDAAGGKVKWGLFFGPQARTLTYTIVRLEGMAAEAVVDGVVSADGLCAPIMGDRVIPAIDLVGHGITDGDETSTKTAATHQENGVGEEERLWVPFSPSCGSGVLACCLSFGMTVLVTVYFGRSGVRNGSRLLHIGNVLRRILR